ncbi:MAG TPA: hypothetical protein VGG20_27990, partial [Thermoanaerobaculia bacterium]
MKKRRSSERPPDVPVHPDGTVADPHANGQPVAATTAESSAPGATTLTEPAKDRPVATFAALSDRTTRIEVAAWARTVQVGDEEVLQFALSIQRSWRDKDGAWTRNG